MMRFDVMTLFPQMIHSVMNESIIGRAVKNGYIEINTVNIRDFSKDKHKKVDDYPYGGGNGLIMAVQPIYDAYRSLTANLDYKPKLIYLSPQGRTFTQNTAHRLSKEKHIILLCGHYEGIDERVLEEIVDEELSIGDYVVTGGELPAMVVIDCVSRLIPGVLATEDSYSDESHFNGLLEYPQYTRPAEILGRKVPEVLLTGHHANIVRWRRKQSLKRTYLKRPDLLRYKELDKTDSELLKEALEEDQALKEEHLLDE